MKKITSYVCMLLAMASLMTACRKDDPLPPPDPPSPKGLCGEIGLLERDTVFSNRLTALIRDTQTKNYETGYMLLPNGGKTFRYQPINGVPGQASIQFSPQGQVDGFIHSHYGGLYPNFSGSDIRAVYFALVDEKINDTGRFITTVVSDNGIAYLLMIEDVKKFLAFGERYFDDPAAFTRFELTYSRMQMESLNRAGLTGSFEIALLEMLSGSGLALFKGTGTFNVWLRMQTQGDGKVSLNRCF
ncbi:hypothetical protein BWD42_12925 [Sphingobacterium sp. CZ-UAM]|uniref:hypothetical protein n=1 Tax=Sphingobacterium sp. CZ-UAM TaxID=1933868 RepID=UPI0009840CC4|nr:hypothetical protein [Sphingobacterium sp. CZ-UAM]OOG18164.1 hypothetical protein BWD42_12925 [Sphingobacterium sp. CZ-UAM]